MPAKSKGVPEKESADSIISKNLLRLKNDKKQIEARLAEIRNLVEEFKVKNVHVVGGSKEAYEELLDSLYTGVELLSRYTVEMDVEIARVTKALKGLRSTDHTVVKKAFEEFIISDVAFSIKNIAMTLYDHDDIIRSMKNLIANNSEA